MGPRHRQSLPAVGQTRGSNGALDAHLSVPAFLEQSGRSIVATGQLSNTALKGPRTTVSNQDSFWRSHSIDLLFDEAFAAFNRSKCP